MPNWREWVAGGCVILATVILTWIGVALARAVWVRMEQWADQKDEAETAKGAAVAGEPLSRSVENPRGIYVND